MIPLDELKKVSPSEKPKPKISSSTTKHHKNNNKEHTLRPIQESDVDLENLPVIQGSFEITKTDADIAQKRSDSTVRPTLLVSTSTLKPFFISPASIKVNPSEKQFPPITKSSSNENIVEMFLQHQKQMHKEPVTGKIEKTNKNGDTTVSKVKLITSTLATSAPHIQKSTSPHTESLLSLGSSSTASV